MRSLSKKASLFSLLRQSLRGDEQNFTEGSINRAIFLLSVPMILEMLMESLFAVVDVYFVSKLGDNDAVATVGLTESVITLIYSVAFGLSMGVTAMVARRVGEKDIKAAGVAAIQSFYVALTISSVISVIGLVFAKDILRLMGASEDIIENHSGYTRWMFGGNITIMMLFVVNAVFRGAGNASIAMRALMISNGLNIMLDPVFIFGWGPVPGFGVEGAGIATTLGRGCGVMYQLYHLLKGKGLVKIHRENLRVRWTVIKKLLALSAGGTGQFIIASASWIFLMRIMSSFGSAALAGYTIAIRVIIFTILPAWGFSNAAATLVGQNLGAGQPERAEKSAWRAAFLTMMFLGLVSLFFMFSAPSIIRLFTADAEVISQGVKCLRIICLGYIFYAYGMVISQSFNGAGDTVTPTILNFFGFWVLQIPLAYTLAILLQIGPAGVYTAVAASESVLAIVCIIVFRRGKWKATKV